MAAFGIIFMINRFLLSRRRKHNPIKARYPKAIFAFLSLTALLIPAGSSGSISRLLHFEWSYDTSLPQLAGYTVYHNGVPIVNVFDPTALMIDSAVILESGTNSFTMTAFDGTGNESPHSAPYVLEVPPEDGFGNMLPLPKIKASGTNGEAAFNVEFDAGESIDYDGIITGYQWDFDDGYGAEGDMVDHTFHAAGIYRITLTVQDNGGATAAAGTTITVTDLSEAPNMPPEVIITASTASGAAPLLIHLDGTNSHDPDGSIVEYLWDFGDGDAAQGDLAVHTFASAGVYPVTLTVTDDRGATSLAETIIRVIDAARLNSPPTAANSYLRTFEETAATGRMAGWDRDGDALSFSIASKASLGSVLLTDQTAGFFTYQPNADAFGVDSFTFLISDGQASSNLATVFVRIDPVNDPPVALPDSVITQEDLQVSIEVLANDRDADHDPLSIIQVANGGHGTARIISNRILYIPEKDYCGQDEFTYQVSDGHGGKANGTVNVSIVQVNDAPQALDESVFAVPGVLFEGKLSAHDPEAGPLAYTLVDNPAKGVLVLDSATGTYTYHSEADAGGDDSFTFTASDGESASNEATVIIHFDQPVAEALPLDFDGDNSVGLNDLIIFSRLYVTAFLTCSGDRNFNREIDLNRDGCIASDDARIFYSLFSR